MCLGEIAQVIEVRDPDVAVVAANGRTRTVSLLTMTDPVRPRDFLVIHSGFALARITAEQAREATDLREATSVATVEESS